MYLRDRRRKLAKGHGLKYPSAASTPVLTVYTPPTLMRRWLDIGRTGFGLRTQRLHIVVWNYRRYRWRRASACLR